MLIGNGFKSILSNQAAIDNAKEAPWWIAVILLVFSVIIPLIPIYVGINKNYGASFLASATYGFDRGIAKATEHFSENGYEFSLEKNVITYLKDGNPVADTFYVRDSATEAQYSDIDTVQNQYNFRFYITDLEGSALSKLVNKLDKRAYKVGTTTIPTEEEVKEKVATYVPNFIILSRKTLAAAVYKNKSTTRVGTTYGGLNWAHTKSGNLIEQLLKDVVSTDEYTVRYATILKNWKKVFNQTYLDQKTKTTWNTVLIYFGVYTGLMVFLGLMIFLLTRGKNNVFNYLNFWVCQKIAYWLAPTPAILGLVLGFLLGTNMIGQMGFIMLVALRVMWCSMRQLRPIQN